MKEYDILFPGSSHGLAYKGRETVQQRGLSLCFDNCNKLHGSDYMMLMRCINSRGAETTNLRLSIPAHSETLEAIIKVLQEFKSYVDNGEEVPSGCEKIQVKED